MSNTHSTPRRAALRWSLVLTILASVWPAAAEPPGMTSQRTWGQAEKDAFYAWLQEQQRNVPAAQESRIVPTEPPTQTLEQRQRTPLNLATNYLSARLAGYNMRRILYEYTPSPGDGEDPRETDEPASGELDARLYGAELQVGKPVTTWFRQLYVGGYYRGRTKWRLDEDLRADFTLWRVGYHLELAMVPLGLDQTRNIVLRTGLDLLYGRRKELDPLQEDDPTGPYRRILEKHMLDQVTGFQGGLAWSVGYERQLGENFWRVHAMVDGFRAVHLSRDDQRENWSTFGLAVGGTRVF